MEVIKAPLHVAAGNERPEEDFVLTAAPFASSILRNSRISIV